MENNILKSICSKTDLCHLQTLLDQVPKNLEVTVLLLSPVGLRKEYTVFCLLGSYGTRQE